MSSSTQTQSGTSSSTSQSAYAPQVADLNSLFGAANGALTTAQGASAPSNFVAQYTPQQLQTFQNMLQYGNATGNAAAEGNTGAALLGEGAGATAGALSSLGAFDPSATNNTNSVQNAAQEYAEGQNQFIPGEVSNAMLAANQNANDVTLPGIDTAAAGTGNTNSSRAGVASGIVQRGLDEQAAGLSSQLQGNAYDTGLQLAENQQSTNNSQNLGALSALLGGGVSAAGAGAGALSGGITNAGNLFDIAGAGGAGGQAADQANLSNELAQYQSAVSSPYAALQNYLGLIGGNYGQTTNGTTSGTTTSTPSMFSTLGSLLGAGGSLLGSKGGVLGGGSGLLSAFG